MQILGEQIKLLVVMAQLYPLVGADRVCSNTSCYSNRTDLFKSTCDLQKKIVHSQLALLMTHTF